MLVPRTPALSIDQRVTREERAVSHRHRYWYNPRLHLMLFLEHQRRALHCCDGGEREATFR